MPRPVIVAERPTKLRIRRIPAALEAEAARATNLVVGTDAPSTHRVGGLQTDQRRGEEPWATMEKRRMGTAAVVVMEQPLSWIDKASRTAALVLGEIQFGEGTREATGGRRKDFAFLSRAVQESNAISRARARIEDDFARARTGGREGRIWPVGDPPGSTGSARAGKTRDEESALLLSYL